MKSITLAAAVAVGIIAGAPAHAADLKRAGPVTAAPVLLDYSWAGLYFGAQGGWTNSYDDAKITGDNAIGNIVVQTGLVPGAQKTRADGFNVGGHIGANFQTGQFVYGIEADLSYVDSDGSQTHGVTAAPLGIPVGISTTSTSALNWLGTVRGRVGIAYDRVLVFATGGLAVGEVEHTTTVSLSAPAPFGATASASTDDVRWGWALGGGAEYALNSIWRLRADYLMVDLGKTEHTFGATVAGAPVTFRSEQEHVHHLVRAGISARW